MTRNINDSQNRKSWLLSPDPDRIGIMYLSVMLASFILGGIMAALIRTELLSPGEILMDAHSFNRVFTFHGIVMIFLFIIPAIPTTLGNFALPRILKTKDLAHPRMNQLSFWLFAVGSLFTITFLLINSVSTGWTLYTPYSATASCRVTCLTAGLGLLAFSSALTGLNFIRSIHRRPGRTSWAKLPLFAWALYFGSVVNILVSLVLGALLFLLLPERFGVTGIFDASLGGDPALFKKLFWLYAYPAVFITILPAMGVVSDSIVKFSRRPIYSYRAMVYSFAAIALFSLFGWGQYLQSGEQTSFSATIFSLLALLLFVPSVVVVLNWLATLYKASIRLSTPMLYAVMFIFLFLLASIAGLFLGNLTTGAYLRGTYFTVAYMHYLLLGGTMMAFLAGLHLWWPKVFGRMFSEKWAALAAILIFLGINISFFTQLLVGVRGLPRRFFNFPDEFLCESKVSSVGAYVLILGMIILVSYLVHSLRSGRFTQDDSWDET